MQAINVEYDVILASKNDPGEAAIGTKLGINIFSPVVATIRGSHITS